MNDRIVYLMRGLPSSGKSFTAKRLAGEHGVILETDQFFWVTIGGKSCYRYNDALLSQAQQWNFDCFCQAVREQRSPIVVDRGCGLNPESQRYARFAVEHGYRLELKEPESPWWQELRPLLGVPTTDPALLDEWALKLAERSRQTHFVPAQKIRSLMASWRANLSVEDILNFGSGRRTPTQQH